MIHLFILFICFLIIDDTFVYVCLFNCFFNYELRTTDTDTDTSMLIHLFMFD